MLASIHPLGERGRNMNWTVTTSSYVAGSLVGGAFAGAIFGFVGSFVFPDLSARTVAILVAAIGVVGLAFELKIGGLQLPTNHRQVNEDWLTTYRGWVYGAGFGAQLGFGLVTIVTSASVYATFLIAAVTGSTATGAMLGAVFGLVRSLAVFAVAHVNDAETLRGVHRKMAERAPIAHRSAVGALAIVAVVGAGGALWL